jgi:biopolymer transport protein ExbD
MTARLRSDINVTPLVDIVLVLLIVFITLVPVLPRALATALPQSGGVGPAVPTLRLTLAANGDLDLDGEPLLLSALPERLRGTSGRLVVRVHPELPLHRATQVLDALKAARPEARPALKAFTPA